LRNELSATGLNTKTWTAPHKLIVPASTLSPTDFSNGVASPVRFDSSVAVCPCTISPSTGNWAPGLMINRIPGCSDSTATSRCCPKLGFPFIRLIGVFEEVDVALNDFGKGNITPTPERRRCRAGHAGDSGRAGIVLNCDPAPFALRKGLGTGVAIPFPGKQSAI